MLDHKYIHPICSKSNHNHSDIHATLHFCLFQESQDTRHSPLPAKFRRYHYHYYISHTMLQGKTGRLLMYTTSSISSFQQIYLSFPDVIMHGTTYYSSFAVDFSLTQRTEQACFFCVCQVIPHRPPPLMLSNSKAHGLEESSTSDVQ